MARALRAWAIIRRWKNSVRNLRYGPRTRLVRGIYWSETLSQFSCNDSAFRTQENMTRDIPHTNRVRGPYRKLRTEIFPPRFMAQARSARVINRRPKNEDPVTYSTDRENEVSKIFIISLVCVWGAQERFLFTRNGFKFLKHLESKTSKFEIVFMSLGLFNT